jgi:hypothetical protein
VNIGIPSSLVLLSSSNHCLLNNGIFDEKDFKSITNPFKVEDGFPATPHDFNIIRPKVDLLIGEETKRPLNFRVIRTS